MGEHFRVHIKCFLTVLRTPTDVRRVRVHAISVLKKEMKFSNYQNFFYDLYQPITPLVRRFQEQKANKNFSSTLTNHRNELIKCSKLKWNHKRSEFLLQSFERTRMILQLADVQFLIKSVNVALDQ